jgi:hypothetical protein
MTWNTDMAFTKVIIIAEGKSAQIRVDATNVWNPAQPTRGRFSSSRSRTVAPGDFSGNITMGNLTATSIFDSADTQWAIWTARL